MSGENAADKQPNRRQVLKGLSAIGIAAAGLGLLSVRQPFVTDTDAHPNLRPSSAPVRPWVWVAQGGTAAERVRAMFKAMGGIGRFVKPGGRVVVKPAIGFARAPEIGANTNPEVVAEVIRICLAAGARSVRVYEHPCDNYLYTFKMSGIEEAVRAAGGEIYPAHLQSLYQEVNVPRGKILHSVAVVREVLEADCFINLPTAKVHSGATLSLGLKNMMGVIWDRRYWHNNGLDRCIADLATILRPTVVLVDATRVLLTNGPQGPGKVEMRNTLIGGQDVVAVDSYAASLFNLSGSKVKYLELSHALGLGEISRERMKIIRV